MHSGQRIAEGANSEFSRKAKVKWERVIELVAMLILNVLGRGGSGESTGTRAKVNSK